MVVSSVAFGSEVVSIGIAVLNATDGESVGLAVVGDAVESVGIVVGDTNEGRVVGLGVVRIGVIDGKSDGLVVKLLVVGDAVFSTGMTVGDADEGLSVGDKVIFFTGMPVGASETISALLKHSFRPLSTGAQTCSASHPRQMSDPSRLE